MKLKISDDMLVLCLYILSFMMIAGQVLRISWMTSTSFKLSFIIVFLLWLLKSVTSFFTIDLLALLIICLSFAGVMITCESLSIAYLNKWLMFSTVFLYFSTCLKIKLKTASVKFLFKMNSALIVIMLFSYIWRYKDIFYVTNSGVRYLTYYFYNPNAAALFLVTIGITAVIYFEFYNVEFSMQKKLFCVILCLFLLLQTQSRTSLITFTVFIMISLFFTCKKNIYLPQNKIFYFIIASFPMLFSIVYLNTIDVIEQSTVVNFLISEGKGIDSRQYVWEYALELFKASSILGAYGYTVTSSVFLQMHNSHLEVLVSYGVPVFILVVLFLYLILINSVPDNYKKGNVMSMWAFVIILILGCGEAILFSGGLSFYLLAGQFLIFSRADSDRLER